MQSDTYRIRFDELQIGMHVYAGNQRFTTNGGEMVRFKVEK